MPNDHKVEIIVGVKDLATRSLKGISNTVSNMSKDFGRVGTFVGAFSRNLDGTINKMDRLSNSMFKFNMYTSSIQRNLANIGKLGTVLGGAVAYQGLNSTLQYDYKTRVMQSRMQVDNGTRKDVSDYILNDLSPKMASNPNDLADIGIILGQAGISNSSDMKSLLKSVSYFSEAVDAVPDQAAEMVVSAAKGFNISMKNSSEITDKLTVALNESLLHVEEMPHAIGELAGRAKMLGQNFDSSLVALMTMRNQGMSASQASQDFLHGLSQASRIGNDSVLYKKTLGYFKDLGVNQNIFDPKTKKLLPYPELIGVMEQSMIKGGFVNDKYHIKTLDDFHELVKKNGGKAPDDFWNSMKAMPLIQRVFGAAGQAPILMGMQSTYEEVNKKTGKKTGKVYYGSEALKKMNEDVKNSGGAVEQTHDIIAQSGLYNLKVLGSAFQSFEIKSLDNLVPLISTGSKLLSNYVSGKGKLTEKDRKMIGEDSLDITPLGKFEVAVKNSAKKFRDEGHKAAGDLVENIGMGIIDGIKVGSTFKPLISQIGKAFSQNIVKADWGSNLIEFPYYIIKNGIEFINNIVKGNKDFQAAVNKLPKNLQDPAKLIENLTKGGIALLISGVIVKVIELGIRGVSTVLKTGKIASELTTTIANLFKTNKTTGVLDKVLKEKNINANIVNVYGKVVNDGGIDIPDGGGGTTKKGTKKMAKGTIVKSTSKKLLEGGKWLAKNPALLIGADIMSGALGGPSVTKTIVEHAPSPWKPDKETINVLSKINNAQKTGDYSKVYPGPKQTTLSSPNGGTSNIKVDKASIDVNGNKLQDAIDKNAQTYGLSIFTAMSDKTDRINSSIVGGFNTANERLQNIKVQVQNKVNVQIPQQPAPEVHISGNIMQYLKVDSRTRSVQHMAPGKDPLDTVNKMMNRRLGW